MANNPGRRKIVAGLAAALAVGEVPVLDAEHCDPRLSALRSAFLEACGETKLAIELAHACIRECPSTVLSRSTAELVASFESAKASGLSLADWLRQQTIADFSAGRVVPVQGWIISETEFLLFARLGT